MQVIQQNRLYNKHNYDPNKNNGFEEENLIKQKSASNTTFKRQNFT